MVNPVVMPSSLVMAPAAIGSSRRYVGPQISVMSGAVSRVRNVEFALNIVSSATAGTEVTYSINFNVRNATELGWLAGFGQRYQKFRVVSAHVKFLSAVASSVNGDLAIGLVYDSADTTGVGIGTLMRTAGSIHSQVWRDSPPVKADVKRMALPWYISGTTTGVASGNQQTPFTIKVAAQSTAVSAVLGRLSVDYVIDFTEPVDPLINQ